MVVSRHVMNFAEDSFILNLFIFKIFSLQVQSYLDGYIYLTVAMDLMHIGRPSYKGTARYVDQETTVLIAIHFIYGKALKLKE